MAILLDSKDIAKREIFHTARCKRVDLLCVVAVKGFNSLISHFANARNEYMLKMKPSFQIFVAVYSKDESGLSACLLSKSL